MVLLSNINSQMRVELGMVSEVGEEVREVRGRVLREVRVEARGARQPQREQRRQRRQRARAAPRRPPAPPHRAHADCCVTRRVSTDSHTCEQYQSIMKSDNIESVHYYTTRNNARYF